MEATPEILHLVIELDPAACGGAGGSPDGPLRLDIRYRVAGRPRYRVKITKGRLTPALNAALGDLFREWWLFPGPDRRDPLRVVPRLDGKGMPPEAIDALTPSLTFDLVLDEVIESWLRRPQSWGLFLMMQDPRIRLLVAGPWCLFARCPTVATPSATPSSPARAVPPNGCVASTSQFGCPVSSSCVSGATSP